MHDRMMADHVDRQVAHAHAQITYWEERLEALQRVQTNLRELNRMDSPPPETLPPPPPSTIAPRPATDPGLQSGVGVDAGPMTRTSVDHDAVRAAQADVDRVLK